MKKRMLFMSALMVFALAGCSNQPATDEDPLVPVTPSDDDPDTPEPTVSNVLDAEKLKTLQGDIALKGKANEKYGENANNYVDITVQYKEDSYLMSAYDETSYSLNEGRIFKIGGVPTICGINLKNERVFTEMKDSEGNVASWSEYANPFKTLSLYDFVAGDSDGVYNVRIDTDSALANAKEILASLTNFSFPSIKSFTITIKDGKFASLSATSKSIESYFGNLELIADLEFTAFGDDVAELEYPDPLETKSEHAKLKSALNNLATKSVSFNLTSYSKDSATSWDDVTEPLYRYEGYYSDNLTYIYDPDYYEGSGNVLVDGLSYSYSSEKGSNDEMVFTRNFYPDSEETVANLRSERGDVLAFAAEYFTPESEKEFVCEDPTFAGSIAYYLSLAVDPYSKSSVSVKVTLDDNYEISKIEYTDNDFSKGIIEITGIGDSAVAPFDTNKLVVAEDPFLKFMHTFTYTFTKLADKTVTIVVNSATDITVDGVAATDITFNKKNSLEFTSGEFKYSVYYSSYSKKYSVTVNQNDSYEYGSLVIAE